MSEFPDGIRLAFDLAGLIILIAAAMALRERRAFSSLFAAALAANTGTQVVNDLLAVNGSGVPSDAAIRLTDWLSLLLRIGVVVLCSVAIRGAAAQSEKLLAFGLVAFVAAILFFDLSQAWRFEWLQIPDWARALAYVVAIAAFVTAGIREKASSVGLLALGLAAFALPDAWRAFADLTSNVTPFLAPALTIPSFSAALAFFALSAARADARVSRLTAIALAILMFVGLWNNVSLAVDCGMGAPTISCLSEHAGASL